MRTVLSIALLFTTALAHAQSKPALPCNKTAVIDLRTAEIVMHERLIKSVPLSPTADIPAGTATFRVIIDRKGIPVSLCLFSGEPRLLQPATEAIGQWRYRPYLLNGMPTDVETLITLSYSPPK